MSLFGNLFNVAKVGVGILNGIVNPTTDAPRMKWFIELENGKKVTLCGKYILVHPNPKKVGTYDNNVTEFDDAAVQFVDAVDNDGKHGIWAFNNSAKVDYLVSFSNTGANGNTQQVQHRIPRYEQINEPSFINVTDDFESSSSGNCVVTAVQQDTLQNTFAVVRTGADSVRVPPVSNPVTVAANFAINSIIGTAVYTLYTTGVSGESVTFSWTSMGDVISGCTVSNTTAYPFTVVVNLFWGSPAVAFKFQFDVAKGSVTTPSTTSTTFPDNDRSINSVNIALTTPDTDPAFVKELLRPITEKDKREGRIFKAK